MHDLVVPRDGASIKCERAGSPEHWSQSAVQGVDDPFEAVQRIMPAATVALVNGSISTRLPVSRLRA